MNTWPLYFFGEAGRGKSYMAALIYAEWPQKIREDSGTIDWNCEPVFWRASDISGDIANARFKGTGISDFRGQVKRASLIVLDDIADRNITDARRAALLDLLEWRDGLPLILTGNFDPNELKDVLIDDRVLDRIQKGRQIKFTGPSLRTSGLEILEV